MLKTIFSETIIVFLFMESTYIYVESCRIKYNIVDRVCSTVDRIVIYLKCINFSSFFNLHFKYIGVHLKYRLFILMTTKKIWGKTSLYFCRLQICRLQMCNGKLTWFWLAKLWLSSYFYLADCQAKSTDYWVKSKLSVD